MKIKSPKLRGGRRRQDGRRRLQPCSDRVWGREATEIVKGGVTMQLKELKGSVDSCDRGDLTFGNLVRCN